MDEARRPTARRGAGRGAGGDPRLRAGAPRSEPGNIIMAPDGPRVLDFGIARALESTRLDGHRYGLRHPGVPVPEQAQGQEVDGAADVFALGAVLVAAAGGSAFGAGTLDGPDVPCTSRRTWTPCRKSCGRSSRAWPRPRRSGPHRRTCWTCSSRTRCRPRPGCVRPDRRRGDAAATGVRPVQRLPAAVPAAPAPGPAQRPAALPGPWSHYLLPHQIPTELAPVGGAPDDADLTFVALGQGSSLLIDATASRWSGRRGRRSTPGPDPHRDVCGRGPQAPPGRRPPALRHGPPVRPRRPQAVAPPGVAGGPAADPGVLPRARSVTRAARRSSGPAC
ncbi:hypothetical protein SBADM41S_07215 [Streptomyces badius]